MKPLPSVRLKLCGITRAEDAHVAAECGYHYLGFNFVESGKRFVAPQVAAQIKAGIQAAFPSVEGVAVFQNASPEYVRQILAKVPVQILQFHGDEPPEYLAEFYKKQELKIIKVFAVDENFDGALLRGFDSVSDFYLFDTKSGPLSGGTGKAFDWTLIPQTSKPFFLAGGIGPENIREALAAVRPFALDLNSKLEVAPGVKDTGKIRECADYQFSPRISKYSCL
jgi:phosphoribosylanthranilate isomerase